jgi:signal transduction histidine kinase
VIEQLRLSADAASLPQFLVRSLPLVDADPALLRAVMSNLIGNAVKFTRDRSDARIEVDAVTSADAVCLQVRDNGVGFDAAAAAAVFAPFHRLHDATYAGHGIGLSIVRRAVERHGGKVWAESSPGQGACFSFTLPAAV